MGSSACPRGRGPAWASSPARRAQIDARLTRRETARATEDQSPDGCSSSKRSTLSIESGGHSLLNALPLSLAPGALGVQVKPAKRGNHVGSDHQVDQGGPVAVGLLQDQSAD